MEGKRFQVHVYSTFEDPYTLQFDLEVQATETAKRQFQFGKGVYKVKVWDLRKGDIQPNNPGAAGLILELV